MNFKLKKITTITIGILVSSIIIFNLYSRIDFYQLSLAISQISIKPLIVGILLTILIGLLSGLRYSYFFLQLNLSLSPKLFTSIKSYFIVACFNLVLPSKLGDLGKGFICERLEKKKFPNEIHFFTVYEKISDLFAIVAIFVFLSFLYDRNQISNLSTILNYKILLNLSLLNLLRLIFVLLLLILSPLLYYFLKFISNFIKSNNLKKLFSFSNRVSISYFFKFQMFSILIWLIHIYQMLLFSYACKLDLISIYGIIALILSTLVGLLPLSFAGIGTREISLIYILPTMYSKANILILGILLSTRYIIPSLMGLYFSKDLYNQASKYN